MKRTGIYTYLVLAALVLSLSSSGCMKDRAELEKKILSHDPSFQKTLDKRDSLHKELEAEQAGFLKNVKEIDESISALKERKVQIKQEYSAKIDKIKRQMQPDKRRLERELMEAERKYRREKDDLGNIEKDIKEITSLLDKKDKLAFTQEEIQTWNDRLSYLVEKKEIVSDEIDKLKNDIETTKLKIIVLKI